ncbi:SMI1/KNR4 family protein [uncultured Enterococcus sp.]|uniref:SMI1/KNR4 family protein n=1 Tax=uncultured Enterococcus sp. TaxID=167972 RepID=UPI002AA8FA6B|nr:SMI1/KNR4 family protein [uncultured Enterococcus sp.]
MGKETMEERWADFDFSSFWKVSDYAKKTYEGNEFEAADIAQIETALGYKLPEMYLSFMKKQNGGMPLKDSFRTETPTSWSENGVAIEGFLNIGLTGSNALLGDFGSRFWLEEWGYPDIGIAICDCPSAGHDMIFLDYKIHGTQDVPAVVHIDQEMDYKITFLAKDFESFVRNLVEEEW